MLNKENIKELLKIKGEVRGMNLKSDFNFVLEKGGKEAVKKIEKIMEDLGFSLKKEEIRPMDFYPLGWGTVFLLVIKDFFNFDENDIEEWGKSIVKFSLITKIFMSYYVAFGPFQKETSRIWTRYYTVGDLEFVEYDTKKKIGRLILKDFNIHPIYCSLLRGYFSKVCEMLIKTTPKCEETKCFFKGGDYHEFLFTW